MSSGYDRTNPVLAGIAERYMEAWVGEARRRAQLREAMQAAFALGGVEAVKELLAPGQVERCPCCEDGYVERYAQIAGANLREKCAMCDGKRYVTRLVRQAVPGKFMMPSDQLVGCWGGWRS